MTIRLGGMQLEVMRTLWERGEASVADVQEALRDERSPAYSTVATVLGRMEKKGLVTHREEGRTFFYSAAVSPEGVGESMVGDLVNNVFGGSATKLVNHLLESEYVDPDELEAIKKLVKQHERDRAKQRRSKKRGS